MHGCPAMIDKMPTVLETERDLRVRKGMRGKSRVHITYRHREPWTPPEPAGICKHTATSTEACTVCYIVVVGNTDFV